MSDIETKIIDGRLYANELMYIAGERLKRLKEIDGLVPGLAVVMVGDNPSSQIYVNLKVKKAEAIGIKSMVFHLQDSATEIEILELISGLNNNSAVHGILVQMPLPKHLDQYTILNAVDPAKDVDGFTAHNVGLLQYWHCDLVPCTPQGIMILLKKTLGNIGGAKAVVIGRSLIVGRPTATLLLRENCTVTIMHSQSNNVAAECRTADIIVAAAGQPKMVKGSWLKPGCCLIDVGITRLNGENLVGDVDFEDVQGIAGYVTPVPGGVGPMTLACLLGNTLVAAKKQLGLPLLDVIE